MPEAQQRLREHDWNRCIKMLTLYAAKLLRRYYWGRIGSQPEPYDLAMDAVSAVILGSRRWDPEQHPDLGEFLCGVVASLVSHRATAADNRKTKSDQDHEASSDRHSSFVDRVATFQDLRAAVGRDAELEAVLGAYEIGFAKPQEIAEHLKIPVAEVHNRERRLVRRARDTFGAASSSP